jgi:hypothetical protein
MHKIKPGEDKTRNKNRILIHLKDDYTFEKVPYNEEVLKNKIEPREYEAIINETKKIMANAWAKKRINDQVKFPKFIILLAILSIVLIFVYMFLLYSSVDNSNGDALVIASLVCVSIGSVIVFSLSIYNFCRETGKFKTLRDIIRDDLNNYLSNLNKKFEGLLFFFFNYDNKCMEISLAKSNDSKNSQDQVDQDIDWNKDINPILDSESALCSDNNIKIPKTMMASHSFQPLFKSTINNLNNEEESDFQKHFRAKSHYSKEIELVNQKQK